jgi:protein-disulfide isomerase
MQTVPKKLQGRWWKIAFFAVLTLLAILFVAFGFYVFDLVRNPDKNNINNNEILDQLKENKITVDNKIIIGTNNYWLGSANPKITIVEFGDFNCSNCKNSFPNIREISLKYKDSVKIIFRDFPVLENSSNLALAGRCAGEQGLFWVMHDKLFTNQGEFEINQLSNFANQIGADVKKFTSCLENEKYISDINKDYADGKLLEITGTPTWFINGYKIEGNIPYNIFIQIIEALIKK